MDKTLDLDEAIARLVDPSSWRVFDSELERVKRHHPNGGYDPDNFKDRASLALASRILTLIAAARPAVVSDEVVERMCRAHDDEDAAMMGEPSLWVIRDRGDFDGSDAEWETYRSERLTAMRAALALLPGGVPDREAIARVISDHVRQINRVVASGMHEGPAIQAAADAIIAMLSASPKGSSRSQPSRTTQEPPSPTPCDLEGE